MLEAELTKSFCHKEGEAVGKEFAAHARVAFDFDGDGEVSCEEYTSPAAHDATTVKKRPACALSPKREAQFVHLLVAAAPAPAKAAAEAATSAGPAPRAAVAAAAALGWALL